MDTQELVFWIAVGIIVVTLFLWFGKEMITHLIGVQVQVNP